MMVRSCSIANFITYSSAVPGLSTPIEVTSNPFDFNKLTLAIGTFSFARNFNVIAS